MERRGAAEHDERRDRQEQRLGPVTGGGETPEVGEQEETDASPREQEGCQPAEHGAAVPVPPPHASYVGSERWWRSQ